MIALRIIIIVLLPATSSFAEDPFAALMLSPLDVGLPAPAIQLPTLNGDRIHSKDWAGHVVVLNFWATWCGPCKEEMPSLEQLYRRLQTRPFKLYAVTADIQPQAIKAFWQHLDLHFPVLLDEDGNVAQQLKVRTLPTTIIIGPDGRIYGRAMGPRDWDKASAVQLMENLMERS